jgi:hypothetical protein
VRAAALLPWVIVLAACSGSTPPITDCVPGHGITPDCRFQNPEDLAVSPSGSFLLVSQFGDLAGGRPGSLVAFEPGLNAITTLFPAGTVRRPDDGIAWGDAACPPPPTDVFSPHGIDLEQLDDGRQALYAINHGGRESVEMFEVHDNGSEVRLQWRGCVVAPEQGYFNDLVVLRDGTFWVSQMFPRDANLIWTLLRMQVLGHTPGFAYHWHPETGFREIPGSRVKFGNGVEKSPDERYLYLNSYLGNAVVKVDVDAGERVGEARVPSPDNLYWSPTGELLAAAHLGTLADTMACQGLEEASCGFRFQIVAIDPETLTTRVLLDHEGPPMGAATVAVPHGDRVYLGTFAGDRIAWVSADILSEPATP